MPSGVTGHEVRREGLEGHIAPIGAQRSRATRGVPLYSSAAHAHPSRGPRLAVVDEHIPLSVGVARHEVRGIGLEPHIPPIGADRRPPAGAARLVPRAVHTHPRGRSRLTVVDEHIPALVAVTRHHVRRVRVDRHVPPVPADGHGQTVVIALNPGAAHAHARRGAGLPITDERVLHPVGVARHEVTGPREERHVPPVSTDRRRLAVAVCLCPRAPDADPPRGPGLAIVHEDVGNAVPVLDH